MRNIMKLYLAFFILFIGYSANVIGSVYYIDSVTGDDKNAGKTEMAPWRTFTNLKSIEFQEGDSILLKNGAVFNQPLELKLNGKKGNPIIVSNYGNVKEKLPVINGEGKELYAVLLENASFCKLENLEITNTGSERVAHRVGIHVLTEDFGVSEGITLDKLFVHDVNGSLVKNEGSGGAIYWENKGDSIKSRFVDLKITNCHIKDCGRNGIYSGGYAGRDNWFPSLGVYVGHNLLEGVPGDGIVPIGCDGAVIEYNVMRDCPDILSPDEAAAGIWPWSCDNTIIQFNEVSGHNAKWDGQGFDADYNCRNTIIQYNYSHDNAGGFLLVCNDGNSLGKNWNKGTQNSVIRYNISVNDGIRTYPTTQAGLFSPVFHITGPTENTMIYNNLIVQKPKSKDSIDNRMLVIGDWGNKLPTNTQFQHNVFYTIDGGYSEFDMSKDSSARFLNNIYLGGFINTPEDWTVGIEKHDIQNVLYASSVEEKVRRLKEMVFSYDLKYDAFHPGELWLDNEGEHINAHGGGVIYADGKYYWFGEHKSATTSRALVGVNCYSSEDLYNWKKEGVALSVVKDDETSPITVGCVIERPKVVFNEKTNKYVMFFHLELKGQGYGAAQVGIATSDQVTGPYTFVKSLRPNPGKWPVNMTKKQKKSKLTTKDFKDWWTPEWHKAVDDGLFVRRDFEGGQMSRDMTVFVDDDGKAYHIYSSEENLTIQIAELTDDYLSYTGKYTRLFPGGHNEAPAIFKYKGKYYMITSGCTGWAPNAARSAVATSIWGPWKSLGNPCVGEGSNLTFGSQSTFILPVHGKEDTFIFMADRWRPEFHIDGRYIWLPIEMEGEKPVIKWQKEWTL